MVAASICAGLLDLDGVVAEVGQVEAACAAGRRWRADWRSCGACPVGARSRNSSDELALSRRTALRACSERIHFSSCAAARGSSCTSRMGTWWARQKPSTLWPSTSSGPVQPLGERRTIIGQRAVDVALPLARALLWMARISSTHCSSVAAIAWCMLSRVVAFDEVRRPAVAAEQALQLFVRDAREERGVGDLVAVEVEDRAARRRRGRG